MKFLTTICVLFVFGFVNFVSAEEAQTPCVYKHGIFTTTSGTEFKGVGAKNKCLTLEREELVKRTCKSGCGTVIGLGLSTEEVKVECDQECAE